MTTSSTNLPAAIMRSFALGGFLRKLVRSMKIGGTWMIRTRDFLYIRNYEPGRCPAGDYRMISNEGKYGDTDALPTKDVMLARKDSDPRLFGLAFGQRPREELYDCRNDPGQLRNLAADPAHRKTLRELSARLTTHLQASRDPRETTGDAPWDAWKYHGPNKWKILPEEAVDPL